MPTFTIPNVQMNSNHAHRFEFWPAWFDRNPNRIFIKTIKTTTILNIYWNLSEAELCDYYHRLKLDIQQPIPIETTNPELLHIF
jgi:hypothetical protein